MTLLDLRVMAYQFPFLQQYLLRTFSDLRILLDSGDTVVNKLYRCVCACMHVYEE